MWTWAHWSAKTALLAATFVTAGAAFSGAAFAGTGGAGGSTSGSGSVLGGDQASVPVGAPVNVCGNAAAVLGDSAAGCEETAAVQRVGASAARPGETLPEATLLGGTPPGSPGAIPMRRLSAVPPAADSLIPGLATLPVMSALAALPSRAASAGPAWQPSLPGGVHLPQASRVHRTRRLPLGTLREVSKRRPGVRGKKTISHWRGGRSATASHWAGNAAVTQGAAGQAASSGIAALRALPEVTGTPGPTSGAAPAALSALTTGRTAAGKAMSASTVAAGRTAAGKAMSASALTAGMGATSFYSLAIGALMAGAVALKMAGRRIQGRKA